MRKCDVCGKRFIPRKEAVYQATEKLSVTEVLTRVPKMVDATDCPRCGCQILLKIRMPIVESEDNKNENEN